MSRDDDGVKGRDDDDEMPMLTGGPELCPAMIEPETEKRVRMVGRAGDG